MEQVSRFISNLECLENSGNRTRVMEEYFLWRIEIRSRDEEGARE